MADKILLHPKLKAYIEKDPYYEGLSDPTTDDAWIAENTSDVLYKCPHCDDFEAPEFYGRLMFDTECKVDMRVIECGYDEFIGHMVEKHGHEPSEEWQNRMPACVDDEEECAYDG
jgi:hypothetical protein